MTWQLEAKCAGKPASLFFFETDTKGTYRYTTKAYKEARSICMNCGVAKKCYDFALNNDEQYGVWGGVNFSQRHKYSKKSRASMINKQHENFMKEYGEQ